MTGEEGPAHSPQGLDAGPELPPRARDAERRILWVEMGVALVVIALILYVAISGVLGIGPYAPVISG